MALFRMSMGGGSSELHGAKISVLTNESTLANKQAILYKSSDTSRTTPIMTTKFSAYSSGSCTALFNGIQEVATYYAWTTDGTQEAQTDNVSVTATQIVNKTTLPQLNVNFAKTYTVTLSSAVNDTVYYYDKNDTSKTKITLATTNTSGTASNVTFSFPANLNTITLYSTVAKSSANGTGVYSKTITLTDGMTAINIRPSKFLYWYGLGFDSNLEVTNYVLKQWQSSLTSETPTVTRNTNSFKATASAGQYCGAIFSKTSISLSSYSKIKVITTSTSTSSAITTTPTKANGYDPNSDVVYLEKTLNTLTYSATSGYIVLPIRTAVTVSAILLE